MDVIYAGQLLPVWEIRGNMLSQFSEIWRVLTPFLISQNFAQKKLPNKRTLKFYILTKNPIMKSVSHRYVHLQFYIDFTPQDIWSVFDVVLSY